MALFGPVARLDADTARDVLVLGERAGPGVGHTPLGGADWRQLVSGPSNDFVAAWATVEDDKLVAYVQLVRSDADPTWLAEVIVDDAAPATLVDLGAPLLGRCLQGAAELGGGHVHYWATAATAAHAELAARAGLEPHRGLHQMRRSLPVGEPYELPLRAFVPGADEDAVLEVNRLAFADHPDQGHMTRAMLEERMAQPWFDPGGFLLTHAEGRLAGFCWTKLFADSEPVLGEIHVICVHPDFAGRRLGRLLVLAGLDHLAQNGATVGMLFVEADNRAALELYHKLGFGIVRTDRAFAATLATTHDTR